MMRSCIHLALAVVLGSCTGLGLTIERGNGIAVTTPVEVEEFTSISIPSSVDVVCTISDEGRSVVFTCDENLLEYYDIHVEGTTLVADTKRGTISLVCKDAGGIDASVSGSGNINLSGTAGNLQGKRTGGGKINSESLSFFGNIH